MQQEEMGEKVENNKSSIAKMYNSPKPLVPSKGAIRTSAGYMLVHQDRVDEDRVQEKRTKKRKLSERLEEPIEVKTSGRCRKANVNCFCKDFHTMLPNHLYLSLTFCFLPSEPDDDLQMG